MKRPLEYFAVYPAFRRHPKFWKLVKELDLDYPTVAGLLVLLWSFAADVEPDGDLSDVDPQFLGREIGWKAEWGDPAAFLTALKKCGLINSEDGVVLYNWSKRQPAIQDRLKERQRYQDDPSRRIPRGTHRKPTVNPPGTQKEPIVNPEGFVDNSAKKGENPPSPSLEKSKQEKRRGTHREPTGNPPGTHQKKREFNPSHRIEFENFSILEADASSIAIDLKIEFEKLKEYLTDLDVDMTKGSLQPPDDPLYCQNNLRSLVEKRIRRERPTRAPTAAQERKTNEENEREGKKRDEEYEEEIAKFDRAWGELTDNERRDFELEAIKWAKSTGLKKADGTMFDGAVKGRIRTKVIEGHDQTESS